MSESLEPAGTAVFIDDVEVVSPGLTGIVEVYYPGAGGSRGPQTVDATLRSTLEGTGLQHQVTIEISNHAEDPLTAGLAGRPASHGEPGLTITVPGPGTGLGQVLLASDESGMLSWVFAEDLPGAQRVSRGDDRRSYTVPRSVIADSASEKRGLLGAIGRKLLEVFAFPLIGMGAKGAAQHFAALWEADHHPYRLRDFTPETYRSTPARSLSAKDLPGPADGRVLLLLHDAMDLTSTGFRGLSATAVADLQASYGGRVFAFDHPTLSVSPTDNARALAQLIAGSELELDILAHGRGGLVARVLAEQPDAAGLSGVTIRRVAMVAPPNAGTVLADFDRLGDLVDIVTNLLDIAPDVGVTDVLSLVIGVVKQLAVGALTGLDGLTAMQPNGDYLRWLNQPGRDAAAYFAVASDYDPPPGSRLGRLAQTHLINAAFAGAANDLLVPVEGVSAPNGATPFPITELLTLKDARSVDHSSYWTSPGVLAQLMAWLSRLGSRPVSAAEQVAHGGRCQ
jgi:hypothetical protein